MRAAHPAIARLVAPAAVLLLGGCSATVPLPAEVAMACAPRMLHVSRLEPGRTAVDQLLVAQEEAGAIRWSLFDPLGAPVTRQILADGAWRNDGFVMPDAQARALFTALLFAWTPEAELALRYGPDNVSVAADGSRVLRVGGSPVATVRPEGPDHLRLTLPGHGAWTVAPLGGQ